MCVCVCVCVQVDLYSNAFHYAFPVPIIVLTGAVPKQGAYGSLADVISIFDRWVCWETFRRARHLRHWPLCCIHLQQMQQHHFLRSRLLLLFLSTFLLLLPSNVVDPTSLKRYVCPSHLETIASWATSELSFLFQHSPRTCSSSLSHFTVCVLLVESYLRARVVVGLWSGHWMTLKRFCVIVCGEGLYSLLHRA
jgi:hypothetical protein